METIYFDTCALNRLSDDTASSRVRAETDAVVQLLDQVATNRVRWVASAAIRLELERNPDPIRRVDALAVFESAHRLVVPQPGTLLRARQLAAQGLRGLDSLHLALAELENVHWLVTTDDRFLKLGCRLASGTTELINR